MDQQMNFCVIVSFVIPNIFRVLGHSVADNSEDNAR